MRHKLAGCISIAIGFLLPGCTYVGDGLQLSNDYLAYPLPTPFPTFFSDDASMGIPVISDVREWVNNDVLNPGAPEGGCVFASLEMWQKYLVRNGFELKPVGHIRNSACSVRTESGFIIDKYAMNCLGYVQEIGSMSIWVDKVIPFVREVRHSSPAENHANSSLLKEIYYNLVGANDKLPANKSWKRLGQPTVVWTTGETPDTFYPPNSTNPYKTFRHAVMVSALWLVNDPSKTPFPYKVSKIRIVNPYKGNTKYFPNYGPRTNNPGGLGRDGNWPDPNNFFNYEVPGNEWEQWTRVTHQSYDYQAAFLAAPEFFK